MKTATQVTWGNPVAETVNYSGIDDLTVVGGSGNNTIIDPGSQNTTIIGGPANNMVVIANTVGNGVVFQDGGGTNHVTVVMGDLLGPVTLESTTGTTDATVTAHSGTNVLTLTANQLGGDGETINLSGTLASLTIDGSSGQNQLVVVGSVSTPLILQDVAVGTTTALFLGQPRIFRSVRDLHGDGERRHPGRRDPVRDRAVPGRWDKRRHRGRAQRRCRHVRDKGAGGRQPHDHRRLPREQPLRVQSRHHDPNAAT